MKRLVQFSLLLFAGLLCGALDAQTATNTPTATVSIVAPKQAATATVTPATLTVTQGGVATLTFSVKGAGSLPTGTVELLGKAPGQTAFTKISSFTLENGTAVCSYPIPSTAPPGTYSVEAAYSGDANYFASPAFQ